MLEICLCVVNFDFIVLFIGEIGIGKSMIVGFIYKLLDWKEKLFFLFNCGVIFEGLIEVELFGYVDGVFSGFKKGGKSGFIEVVDGGILLFDEIDLFSMDF